MSRVGCRIRNAESRASLTDCARSSHVGVLHNIDYSIVSTGAPTHPPLPSPHIRLCRARSRRMSVLKKNRFTSSTTKTKDIPAPLKSNTT